ncbi:MAG: cation:proton antiporter [Spirochaetes bacterium RBG_16_49_21]|nr:MAG: cation:proton antiporter [Spirochaetes bacterium RBG_16_49_21]
MIILFDLIILIFVVICAVTAITVKDLLSAVMILGAYSFFMCLLWTEMGAVDVAFTEASVSAGIGTILFIAAIIKTTRRSKD